MEDCSLRPPDLALAAYRAAPGGPRGMAYLAGARLGSATGAYGRSTECSEFYEFSTDYVVLQLESSLKNKTRVLRLNSKIVYFIIYTQYMRD